VLDKKWPVTEQRITHHPTNRHPRDKTVELQSPTTGRKVKKKGLKKQRA